MKMVDGSDLVFSSYRHPSIRHIEKVKTFDFNLQYIESVISLNITCSPTPSRLGELASRYLGAQAAADQTTFDRANHHLLSLVSR